MLKSDELDWKAHIHQVTVKHNTTHPILWSASTNGRSLRKNGEKRIYVLLWVCLVCVCGCVCWYIYTTPSPSLLSLSVAPLPQLPARLPITFEDRPKKVIKKNPIWQIQRKPWWSSQSLTTSCINKNKPLVSYYTTGHKRELPQGYHRALCAHNKRELPQGYHIAIRGHNRRLHCCRQNIAGTRTSTLSSSLQLLTSNPINHILPKLSRHFIWWCYQHSKYSHLSLLAFLLGLFKSILCLAILVWGKPNISNLTGLGSR